MDNHDNSTHFQPRTFGLKELATLYFPDIAPASASIRLKHWIMTMPQLLERLKKTNYRTSARILSPKQVTIIVDEFGEP